jgi:magnesium transporter
VPLIRAIEFEVDSIDELVLILKESEQSDMLRRIGHCRKKMMSLLRLLVAKSDVIKTLIKRGSSSSTRSHKRPNVARDVVIYMGDIQGKQLFKCYKLETNRLYYRSYCSDAAIFKSL